MSSVTLIFPHQLFKNSPALDKSRKVYVLEDPIFFTHFKFHKQKLILHRAGMKYYTARLQKLGYQVEYLEFSECENESLFRRLNHEGVTTIHYCDVVDYLLERRIRRYASREKIALKKEETPNFISTAAYNAEYFSEGQKLFQTDYYIDQRKRLGILIQNEKPVGGKWTYDVENRKKLPKNISIPELSLPVPNEYITEAKQYISKHFSENYGDDTDFIYPVTHADADKWLEQFIEQRFINFGIYQDAIVEHENFLFHSILSPLLNCGLLDPLEVLHKILEAQTNFDIPLNAVEGFVRQLIGWREFVRAVYTLKGTEIRTKNYWSHDRKIPHQFYTGSTGIVPVDASIKRLLKYAYSHHIERLMVLGNFMLLSEFHPDEVYQWFMEMYIDAYDWVMVPNVYGMSQYADGGLMTTKPYISGSNYLNKMSDYPKGEWGETWDALYWNFIDKHNSLFARNPRMSMMCALLNKMEAGRRTMLLSKAEKYFYTLQ
ncbi:cryptochrome/photolyase family protein [soil metagenome]